MADIGFIGMGNMGYAMLKGMLSCFDASGIVFTDASQERMENVEKITNVKYVNTNAECAKLAKVIILAVKPQYYESVLQDISNIVKEDDIVISLAPGIRIDYLSSKLEFNPRIVRVMPNTPALVGAGITGVAYQKDRFSSDEEKLIENIFRSIGEMVRVDEALMNAVVCASGSSPAYVYMFIEALADSVVKYGMPRDMAYKFAASSVLGSAKMVLETGEHPGILKDRVCSPGGTTIAGVAALEEYGFRNAVFKATDACYEKNQKLQGE
ncbi:pyrroline-5-carboxylate reductase [Parasporobacterium paucivorans]|uniref:Pyrroline-5-carboxylate reductase n=1 Tax=Parasporobacterium paucivorans DSM 15970 TaxID=1122934 RepID=A0A1M6F8L3_9FIRM|nr:pyrroline-5-carboxylate reductase [Parasporobacterium paucivorans]SHI94013.1 pyrroline-5-carboxylate reductase [Parasporobacterium paucivorans DSM 15970]